MEIRKFYNPFDFANPVSDSELFAGRQEELTEIRYYLDLAASAPRAINLAFIGERAAGKTSLLNVTEIEAETRGFCTVRIDLDESDTENQMALFFRLFDGVLTAACYMGAFGGQEGKTFDTYLDIVNSYCIPENKTFCPFLFPLQYARAMSSGAVRKAQLADQGLRGDLLKIRREIDRPILLLIDEGDVLAKSRVHLQKLRNVFMNTPGYMLVIAGTPNLFPVMDEVFSPIGRQFKRITVGQFAIELETERCILRPLEKLGLPRKEVSRLVPRASIEDVHSLSGGRPYEIQLICHTLFRRVQQGTAKTMRLSIDVIEEVRKEIGRAQDVSLRPTLTKIRGLTQSQLSALNTLVACDQRATLAEIQGLEYVLEGTAGQSRTELGEAFEHFQKLGILATDTDAIRFLGDEFDKIYVKYFAREREILFSFPDLTPERLFRRRMQRLPNPRIAMQLSWYDSDLVRDVDESTSAFAIDQYNAVSLSRFVYSQTVTRATETAIAYKKDRQSTITVVRTRAHLPWFNTTLYCAPQDPGNVAVLDDWLLAVESVRQRVEELEGSLETEKRWLAPVPVEAIVEKAESLGPPAAKQVGELTFPGLMKSFIDRYMESGMAAEVLAHANLAYRYLPSRPASDNVIIPHLNTALNSIGYVFMAAGEIERAREVLGKGLTVAEDANDVAILRYNLGLCEAISGNLEKALDHIGSSIELTSPTAPEFLCLFRPVTVDGTLVLDEIREHPRLLDVASEAQVTLSAPFHE